MGSRGLHLIGGAICTPKKGVCQIEVSGSRDFTVVYGAAVANFCLLHIFAYKSILPILNGFIK